MMKTAAASALSGVTTVEEARHHHGARNSDPHFRAKDPSANAEQTIDLAHQVNGVRRAECAVCP